MINFKDGNIAFQGELGAFSHQACHDVFPDMHPMPCVTFDDTFAAVQNGEADLAMLPVENSLYGRVADIHTLLPQSNLYIIQEYFLPIHLNLMVNERLEMGDIEQVISHTVALGQCRNFIKTHGLHAQAVTDTAGAAKAIAADPSSKIAAVGSKLASKIYNLEILAENIEDADHNTTRFVVVSRQKIEADPSIDKVITSFVFEVKNVPAALYKALGGFATTGVNMVKLESYMVGGSFSATQFYADIEGHPNDPMVKLALDELSFFTEDIRILGVYPRHPFRD